MSTKKPSKRERDARRINAEEYDNFVESNTPPWSNEDPQLKLDEIARSYRDYFARTGMSLEDQVAFTIGFLATSELELRDLRWFLERAERHLTHLRAYVQLQRLSDGMALGLPSFEPFSPLVTQAVQAAIKADRAQRARETGAATQKRYRGNKARAFKWLDEQPQLSIAKSKAGLKEILHISESTAERYVLEWRAKRHS